MGSLLQGAQQAEGTAIIIDVFRCFTTAAVALSKGVEKIVLVSEIDEALRLRDDGVGDLCMGEVSGRMPTGFDFGNSPYEISQQADIRGKTIIQSTRAGTVGVNAATRAKKIYGGSFAVAGSTVAVVNRSSPSLVSLVAMGADATVRADEDEQCALYLRNLFLGRDPNVDCVKSLVLAGEEAQKYDDISRSHFHPEDRRIALQINAFPFAIGIHTEHGLLVARAEYA